MFSNEFSFWINPTNTAINKKIYDAFPVVKKLPVLFKGKISEKNKNINGVIIILSFKGDLKKYFFIKLKYKIIIKIDNINKKPICRVPPALLLVFSKNVIFIYPSENGIKFTATI